MRQHRQLDVQSLWTFVMVGLPDGVIGTAWPAMRSAFHVPVGDLGIVLLVNTIGYVVIAMVVGRLLNRHGTPMLLAVAAAVAACGATGYAAAPQLFVVLMVGPLVGIASGTMDGALNTSMALNGRRRLLNLLHAAYGVGTALGPLLVTAILLIGSWRYTFVVLAVLDLGTALLWLRLAKRKTDEPGKPARSSATPDVALPESHPSEGWSRCRTVGVLGVGLIVFFLYTGLEVSAGQWATSYARYRLHLTASAAGLIAFGFWAALTVARVLLAIPAKPPRPQTVIHWGIPLVIGGAILILALPTASATAIGFITLGAAAAGIFPALIALTPQRLGAPRASAAIGWQVGAAAGGGSAISALIGLLINTFGIAVLGPALMAIAILFTLATLTLEAFAPPCQTPPGC